MVKNLDGDNWTGLRSFYIIQENLSYKHSYFTYLHYTYIGIIYSKVSTLNFISRKQAIKSHSKLYTRNLNSSILFLTELIFTIFCCTNILQDLLLLPRYTCVVLSINISINLLWCYILFMHDIKQCFCLHWQKIIW